MKSVISAIALVALMGVTAAFSMAPAHDQDDHDRYDRDRDYHGWVIDLDIDDLGEDFMDEFDEDGDGRVSWREFDDNNRGSRRDNEDSFEALDGDGDGYIVEDEFVDFVEDKVGDALETVEMTMRNMDGMMRGIGHSMRGMGRSMRFMRGMHGFSLDLDFLDDLEEELEELQEEPEHSHRH